jgi:hypothetical protein
VAVWSKAPTVFGSSIIGIVVRIPLEAEFMSVFVLVLCCPVQAEVLWQAESLPKEVYQLSVLFIFSELNLNWSRPKDTIHKAWRTAKEEISSEDVGWIHVAQHRDPWRVKDPCGPEQGPVAVKDPCGLAQGPVAGEDPCSPAQGSVACEHGSNSQPARNWSSAYTGLCKSYLNTRKRHKKHIKYKCHNILDTQYKCVTTN